MIFEHLACHGDKITLYNPYSWYNKNMKKINTSPISGTQELLPTSQFIFDTLKAKITKIYRSHGFLNIETPILERTEVLFAKAGGDTEKQIYEVKKTGEDADKKADEALRFDHTVPLARYIVEHESDLSFPFKVSQIGENFRGERAQRGRFREFYQCDADIIGRNDLPIFYDADIIDTLIDAYQSFELKTPVVARISNRKILKGLLEGLNLQDKSRDISSIIDHSEKVPREKTEQNLLEIGLTEENQAKILQFIDLNGDIDSVANGLKSLGVSNPTLDEGIAELAEVISILKSSGHEDIAKADLRIIRGLDYYTGTVFEFALPEYPEIGSIGGGGRYDNLTGYFSDQKFPGVGGSIGLNRLFFVLNEKNLLSDAPENPIDYAIIPISTAEIPYALEVAKDLRTRGASVTIVSGDKKLADKLKYASKLVKNAIILGEEEVKNKSYEIKRFI